MKDTLFAQPHEALGSFQFNESVAAVFPDMIQRSVPGYQTILTGIGELTALYAQPDTQLYDLGCSLGAATLTMRRQCPQTCRLVAIDNAPAMIERARTYLEGYHSQTPVELVCGDVQDQSIENASVVVINFTLQFIDPQDRLALLKRIHAGLKPGGILILSEKIHFDQTPVQTAIEHLHLQFKRANGYSELEIGQKRNALEDVLISDSRAAHLARLQEAGFEQADTWFQAYNFASFLAIKTA
ncbi:carboxy-S-adenosyl-L-methionine synthase CmoA [Thiomicrospira sp. WB1]|jgi:tRNA (cmo5U34)-methyltransferase|uniref:carboxy-S-adenosyl-L-methionine synthase CmoA n=1 Tax=Thiomicrospira sp. WB1 TaxID=1685380 RepID=UPI000746DB08|nr:carboxy-S-adenosyl-L-methionine synthase CmoA [Thiomicrospira sp. WB1]KUJ72262.1 tRNA (cmo5U34)-methyltransferase [Thiomicrospira sp. WB1]